MITISDGRDRATVSPAGAELHNWVTEGREVLWQRDAAYWHRSAPVLFPVVGWCRDGLVRVGEVAYPMPVHGFAGKDTFDVVQADRSSVTVSLSSSAETRAHYPFDFGLDLRFALDGGRLTTSFRVHNPGGESLPYSLGHHPAFDLTPQAGSKTRYHVIFDESEDAALPVISQAGLFTDARREVPLENGRRLVLAEARLDEALCFLNARSTGLRLVSDNGGVLRVRTENFAHFAIWTKPHSPFVSVETWTGHGDPEGFSGEIFDKPSISILKPGEVAEHSITYSFERN